MKYKFIVTEQAQLEYEESASYYEMQQQGLGMRFVDTIEKLKETIAKNPRLFAKKKKEYREVQAKPFPFLIVYRIDKENEAVLVVAVFHTSRHPKEKYKREK